MRSAFQTLARSFVATPRSSFVLSSLAFYVFLQNFLKWIPFPAGQTALTQTTIQENLVSVVAGLALFVVVIASLIGVVKRDPRVRPVDALTGLFGAYLVVQVFFREEKSQELVRTCALGASVLSTVLIGKYFSANSTRLNHLLRVLTWSLLASLVAGIAVALISPASVRWGLFAPTACLDPSVCRAEFFFFTINPIFLTVLVWRFPSKSRRTRILSILTGGVVLGLALLTRTRQFTLVILASSGLIGVLWARQRPKILITAAIAFLIAAIFAGPSIIKFVLTYVRVVADPATAAFDPGAADWSSGRLPLLRLLWQTFLDAPLFGVGGVETRALIAKANLIARTEHGFVFYLAAYGIFGLFFIGTIFAAFAKAIKILIQALRGKIPDESPTVTLALIAVPLFPFGFVGLFGSATNPTDWMALAIAALILQSDS